MDGFELLKPVYEFWSKEELSQCSGLVWHLEEGYHVPLDKFVALPHNGGIIILNSDYPNIWRIKEIFTEYCTIDNRSRYHKRLDKLWDEFKELAGKENMGILCSMGDLYRKRREKANLHTQATEIIKLFRKNRITAKKKGKEDIIHAIFSIGWDKKDVHGGSALGAEYCFLYGYLSALNEIREKQQSTNIQDKCVKEKLIEMLDRLSENSLKRIYELACFLYTHYEKGGEK